MRANVRVTAVDGFEEQARALIQTGDPYTITCELADWDNNAWTIVLDAPAGPLTADSLTAMLEHHIPAYTYDPQSVELVKADPVLQTASPF